MDALAELDEHPVDEAFAFGSAQMWPQQQEPLVWEVDRVSRVARFRASNLNPESADESDTFVQVVTHGVTVVTRADSF